MMHDVRWIEPDWPAPANVRAAATLRSGGVSVAPYASLNLGSQVGDDPVAVTENRRRVRDALALPSEPVWLNQVHGTLVHPAGGGGKDGKEAPEVVSQAPPTADACVAFGAHQVCVVLTADCLPVLFCDREATRVAAAHAGWRGLAGGILEATIHALTIEPGRLMAWLGPAIEQDAFEVGAEVREQFSSRDPGNAKAFIENARGRWQADIRAIARRELVRLGVTEVYGGGCRRHEDRAQLFSHRRDNRTGRMATMIWLTRMPG